MRVLVLWLLAALSAVTLVLGPRPFGWLLAALALGLLAELADRIGRTGSRPVLLAAALPAVVVPLATIGDPARGWAALPGVVAVMLIGAFALVLAFGRRTGVTAGIAATCLVGLLAGLGITSLLLLRYLDAGFRWVAAFLLLIAVPDAAAAGVARATGNREYDPLVRVVASALLAAALAVALAPPFTLPRAATLAAVALLAAAVGAALARVLSAEGESRRHAGAPDAGTGLVLGMLLGAPAAFLLARSVQL